MQYFGSRNFGRADFGAETTSATASSLATSYGILENSFGSKHFGLSGFGSATALIVGDQPVSSMDVAGGFFIDTCGIHTKAVADLDVIGGMQRLANIHIKPVSTVIGSGLLLIYSANLNLGSGTSTMQSSGYIAWDGQTVPDTTWTTQTIE